jgi:FAD:protein FMN transferase
VIAAPKPAATARAQYRAATTLIQPLTYSTRAMGGRLVIHLAATTSDETRARRDASNVMARVGRWADRLSRYVPTSELSVLNLDPTSAVAVGPTLAGAMRVGQAAAAATDGLVDITLLDARLAAEASDAYGAARSMDHVWRLTHGRRGNATVHRTPGVRFDLDGVAKGWLADRALGLLSPWSGAIVDADGDLAVRCPPGRHWAVAVDDPRDPGAMLAVLYLSGAAGTWPSLWGVATSGTSVHRWHHAGEVRHHLIDPRTGLPTVTDVVQATVVGGSASEAEGLAKAAVIAGSEEGLALLERAGVHGAVLLTDRGETIASPRTLALLDEPGGR